MNNLYEIQICRKDMNYQTIGMFYSYNNALTMLDRLSKDKNFKNISFRIVKTLLTLDIQ